MFRAVRFRSTLCTYLEKVVLFAPGLDGRFRELRNGEVGGRCSLDDRLDKRGRNKGERRKQADMTFDFLLFCGDIGE